MVKYKKLCQNVGKKNKSLHFTKHKYRRLRKVFYLIKYVSPLEFDKNTYFQYEVTKIFKSPKIIEQYNLLKITKEDFDIFKDEISNLKKN